MSLRNEGFFESLQLSFESTYLLHKAFNALLSPKPEVLSKIFMDWPLFEIPKDVIGDICEFINFDWNAVCAQAAVLIQDVCQDASVPGFLKMFDKTWKTDFLQMVIILEVKGCITNSETSEIYYSWAGPEVMMYLCANPVL